MFTRNLSGNIRTQSFQPAEPLWTDPGIKSGTSVHELISASNKQTKKRWQGMNGRTFSQKSSQTRKKPPPPVLLADGPEYSVKYPLNVIHCNYFCKVFPHFLPQQLTAYSLLFVWSKLFKVQTPSASHIAVWWKKIRDWKFLTVSRQTSLLPEVKDQTASSFNGKLGQPRKLRQEKTTPNFAQFYGNPGTNFPQLRIIKTTVFPGQFFIYGKSVTQLQTSKFSRNKSSSDCSVLLQCAWKDVEGREHI